MKMTETKTTLGNIVSIFIAVKAEIVEEKLNLLS